MARLLQNTKFGRFYQFSRSSIEVEGPEMKKSIDKKNHSAKKEILFSDCQTKSAARRLIGMDGGG
jgi:hypothetical protein